MAQKLSQYVHPSIFVAKKGSASPLHSDAQMTRFWMFLLSGKKYFRIFPPSEYHKMYPTDWNQMSVGETRNYESVLFSDGAAVGDLYPHKFLIDAFAPDFVKFPQAAGAIVYETILEEGELIYVPEGWAHAVLNLEDIVATSQNVVDVHSRDTYLRYQKQAKRGEYREEADRLTAFYLPLDHPTNGSDGIHWRDYFLPNHDLSSRGVPSSVKEFVERAPTTETGAPYLEEPRDSAGRSPLHLAVKENFLSVVEYLISKGADVDTEDSAGNTLVDTAMAIFFSRLDESTPFAPEALKKSLRVLRLLNATLAEDSERGGLAAATAIRPLVAMLQHSDSEGKAKAARALGNIAQDGAHRAAIIAANAIGPLVALLQHGDAAGKRYSARAIGGLARDGAHRGAIVAADAIGPLIALMQDGDDSGKATARTALDLLRAQPAPTMASR